MVAPGRSWSLSRLYVVVVGIVLGLFGAALAIGGGYLLALGGSVYFLPMGIALVVSGVLIARSRPAGAKLYAAALLATAVWSVIDAGFEFWPLVSRLFALSILGVLVGIAYPTAKGRPRSGGSSRCSTDAKNASMSTWTIFGDSLSPFAANIRFEQNRNMLRACSHC